MKVNLLAFSSPLDRDAQQRIGSEDVTRGLLIASPLTDPGDCHRGESALPFGRSCGRRVALVELPSWVMDADQNKGSPSPSQSKQKRQFRDLRGTAISEKVARALELNRERRIERIIDLQRKRRVHQAR